MVEKAEGNPKTLHKLVNIELDRKQAQCLPNYTADIWTLSSKKGTNQVFRVAQKIVFLLSFIDDWL